MALHELVSGCKCMQGATQHFDRMFRKLLGRGDSIASAKLPAAPELAAIEEEAAEAEAARLPPALSYSFAPRPSSATSKVPSGRGAPISCSV